jgi:hypothetical protein
LVTIRTTRFNLRSAHTAVFMCFVWISEQTALFPSTTLTDWFV